MHPSGPDVPWRTRSPPPAYQPAYHEEFALTINGTSYTPEQGERLNQIRARLVEARRELDALIGDAYLRPRASIVPVHFLDLASAVEKLRWAEKEWRELEQEMELAKANAEDRSNDPQIHDSHADLVDANN